MNDLKDYDFKINSLKYRKNIIILETDKGKYVYKEKQNNYDIYDYLKSRNFTTVFSHFGILFSVK